MSAATAAANPTPAAMDSINIATHLTAMAERFPDKRAVVVLGSHDRLGRHAEAHLTFRQLERRAGEYARGLQRIGVARGAETILMVKPGLNFFAITFALFKIGAVPVLIDPGMGRRGLVDCLREVQADAFIGVPLAHVLRVMHASAFRSVRQVVTVGRRYFWGGHRLRDLRDSAPQPFETARTMPDEPAAILFTSGSTGPAKGVVYTHATFDAQVRYLQSHYGYGPDEIDLATFPLFALFDAALGMTAVIPDMNASRPGSADPSRIIHAIESQRCTHMFGSPALLDRLSRHGQTHGVRLPTLKRVITAGAPVQPALLERLHAILNPDAEVFTPYGATEALPVASIGSREILADTQHATAAGGGTCVGRPLDGITVRIIEITDEPIRYWTDARELPAGEIGEIVVRGPIVTPAYHRKPDATALAKIDDDGVICHRMGDVGYFDDRGRLWFCGRKAHRVETRNGTLFTVPCETIFNQHPRVRRTALVGVGPRGNQRPVICIEREPDERVDETDALIGELKQLGAADDRTREIDTFLIHLGFPVDVRHNAKIFREKLAEWAAARL